MTDIRPPRRGYRPHDHLTPWQECDVCGLRIGEGIATPHDAAYSAGDPTRCPVERCDGIMCLPDVTDIERLRQRTGLGAGRLAQLLGCDRRSVQSWLAGESPSAARQRQLDSFMALSDSDMANLIRYMIRSN